MPTDRKIETGDRLVKHLGYQIKLTMDHGVWRLRSRSRHHDVNFSTGTSDLVEAKRRAKSYLDERQAGRVVQRTKQSAADLVEVYKSLPKRAGVRAVKLNITLLRAIVRDALGKALEETRVHELNHKLWSAYMAFRQGGTLDLSTRRRENISINSAVKCACSMFIPRLRPLYRERGINLPEDITQVQWLPVIRPTPCKVDDVALQMAWAGLKIVNFPMWMTIGLARFAGLRRKEVMHFRGDWLEEWRGQFVIVMKDRPEQGFLSKTGREYRVHILHPELLAELRKVPADQHAVETPIESREEWFERYPQEWLKPLAGGAKKPLHRLRGLYADQLAAMTEDAQAAKLAGIKAASEALGHTTTKTTTDHYLSES